MANVADLCTKNLTEVAGLIKKKEVSPVELTQAMLNRIAALDGKLYSYLTVTSDLAYNRPVPLSREIAQGKYRGPLHGVPIAVKDPVLRKVFARPALQKFSDWKPIMMQLSWNDSVTLAPYCSASWA
jgi:amidase